MKSFNKESPPYLPETKGGHNNNYYDCALGNTLSGQTFEDLFGYAGVIFSRLFKRVAFSQVGLSSAALTASSRLF